MKKTIIIWFLCSIASFLFSQQIEIIPQQRADICAPVCKFSPDNKFLAVQFGNGLLQLYDYKRKWVIKTFPGVHTFEFLGDGKLITLGPKLELTDLKNVLLTTIILPEKKFISFGPFADEIVLKPVNNGRKIIIEFGGAVMCVDAELKKIIYSLNDKTLLTTSADERRILVRKKYTSKIFVYETLSGNLLDSLVSSINFSSAVQKFETDSFLIMNGDTTAEIYDRVSLGRVETAIPDAGYDRGLVVFYDKNKNRMIKRIRGKNGNYFAVYTLSPFQKIKEIGVGWSDKISSFNRAKIMITENYGVLSFDCSQLQLDEILALPMPPFSFDREISDEEKMLYERRKICAGEIFVSDDGSLVPYSGPYGDIFVWNTKLKKTVFEIPRDTSFSVGNGGFIYYTDKVERNKLDYSTVFSANSLLNDYCTGNNVVLPLGQNYFFSDSKGKKDYLLSKKDSLLLLYELPDLKFVKSFDVPVYAREGSFEIKISGMVNDGIACFINGNFLILGRDVPKFLTPFTLSDCKITNDSIFWFSNTLDSAALFGLENGKMKLLKSFGFKRGEADKIYVADVYNPDSVVAVIPNSSINISPGMKWVVHHSITNYFNFINVSNPDLSFQLTPKRDTIRSYEEGFLSSESYSCLPFSDHSSINFIPWNEDLILIQNYDDTSRLSKACIWNIAQRKIQCFFNLPGGLSMQNIDAENQRLVVSSALKGKLDVYDRDFLVKQVEMDTAGLLFRSDAFLNRNMIVANMQSHYTLQNIDNGEKMKLFFTGKEYLIINEKNYYLTSSPAVRDIVFKQDGKYYSFEQFDLKYNRPDLVLKSLGCTDTLLQRSYYRAYLKRLKKMGFSEEQLKDDFNLPELKIENGNMLPGQVDSSSINLDLRMKDNKYNLNRVKVFINDVPVFGTNGISLESYNSKSISKNITVELCRGTNKVEVSVLNKAGAESYKESFNVECTLLQKQKPDLYLVTIGVSIFDDKRYNLAYASKDALDIRDAFKKNNSSVYNKIHTFNLIDGSCNENELESVKAHLKNAGCEDVVIVYVASHGVLDKDLNYYIGATKMDFSNPASGGIPYEKFENLLDGIKPLKKVLFLDACHSGEVDKEDVEEIKNNATESGTVSFRSAGAGIQKKNIGMKNTSELVGELFTDLRKGTGATVVASAGAAEFAMEGKEWKNGLFTYCLLYGLKSKSADMNKDGKIMLSELERYLESNVIKLSKGKQRPASRIENLQMDFEVWPQ